MRRLLLLSGYKQSITIVEVTFCHKCGAYKKSLYRDQLWIAFFRPKLPIGLRYGLWLCNSGTFTLLSVNHFYIAFTVRFGLLSCQENKCFGRYSSRISNCFAAFHSSAFTSLPWRTNKKLRHIMVQPPPCFTVGLEGLWWCAVFGVCQM